MTPNLTLTKPVPVPEFAVARSERDARTLRERLGAGCDTRAGSALLAARIAAR